jgi:hypothetical protein
MAELFPDGEVRRERFLLLSKSFVAVRRPEAQRRATDSRR